MCDSIIHKFCYFSHPVVNTHSCVCVCVCVCVTTVCCVCVLCGSVDLLSVAQL